MDEWTTSDAQWFSWLSAGRFAVVLDGTDLERTVSEFLRAMWAIGVRFED